MENEKIFKILSIDGGGIKGLYSAKILQHFEEKFNCRVSDHFDMICGTSTGGLLALALSLKIPASDICKLYEEHGSNIFPSRFLGWGLIRQILWGGKYTDKGLKKALEETFGDRTLAESNNLLCIPSYSYTDARPWIFKFDHPEGNLDRDNKAKYIDVALATSAAPTYLPLAEIPYYNNKQFIDGGIYANNPTLVGMIEAFTYFVGKDKQYNSLNILSISSLSTTGGKKTGLNRHRSFFKWRDDLFESSLTGQAKFNEYFMNRIHEINDFPVVCHRVPSAELSPEQSQLAKLDNASKRALDLLKGKADDIASTHKKNPDIQSYFKKLKTYQTR